MFSTVSALEARSVAGQHGGGKGARLPVDAVADGLEPYVMRRWNTASLPAGRASARSAGARV
jgi:hypothetical protein